MPGIVSPFWPSGEPAVLPLPHGTMVDALARAAAAAPDSIATWYYGAPQRYGELQRRVEAMAGFLRNFCRVRPGDRVVLAMQNAPHFVVAFHAILRADAVAVPVSPLNKREEIRHCVTDSGARVAILAADLAPEFDSSAGEALDHLVVARYGDALPAVCRYDLPAVVSDPAPPLPRVAPWHAWEDAIAAGHAAPPATRGPEDLAILPYTSGTTGKPKACRHTHGAMLYTAVLQARWYGFDRDSVVTAFMPLFHVAAMQASMNAALVAGATMVITTRWNRDLVGPLLAAHGVTFWNAAPTMIVDVLASAAFSPESFRHLKTITGGGAAMPEAVAAALKARFGLAFVEGYGLTETMSPTHINPPAHPKPQCLGIAVHGTDARVIDPETRAELGPDATGEIVVSGPQVLQGYWNRPDADAEAFITIEGKRFLRTGDLGRYDAEGYFFAVDRLKRMINVSGFKVWPAEVEAALHRHPAIQECCVVAAKDAYQGERVEAHVVLKDGAVIDEAALIHWARAEMAAYKVPRRFAFTGTLPRTASNKIDWRRVQEAAR